MAETLHPSSKGVAALYCLFGDTSWLEYSYRSVYPCVERVMFFASSSPWYGVQRASEFDIARLQELPDPDGKVDIVQGAWTSEAEQRNLTLAYAAHCGLSHGLIIDADEVYEAGQLIEGLAFARARPDISVWHVNWFTYWKSPAYRIDPVEPYQPPILVKLGEAGFVETRNLVGPAHELIPPEICMCHHLSYALSDESLQKKHIMQSGHSQSAYPGWYEEKWKGWDLDHSLENLHPVQPSWFQRAIPQPVELLPLVLRESL